MDGLGEKPIRDPRGSWLVHQQYRTPLGVELPLALDENTSGAEHILAAAMRLHQNEGSRLGLTRLPRSSYPKAIPHSNESQLDHPQRTQMRDTSSLYLRYLRGYICFLRRTTPPLYYRWCQSHQPSFWEVGKRTIVRDKGVTRTHMNVFGHQPVDPLFGRPFD